MRQETTTERDKSPVEAAVSAAVETQATDPDTLPAEARAWAEPAERMAGAQATRLPLQCLASAFTLAELLVTIAVLALLVFFASQLLKSAAAITTIAHKRMDIDAQSRQLLDRMAIDFAQMVKRSDVDYYLKSSATPPPAGVRTVVQPGQTTPFPGNDIIAFYSAVPGYYPSSGAQSPVSLVAYRVNQNTTPGNAAYLRLERMGKGLVWNAVSTTDTPVLFMPIPIASPIPTPELPPVMPSPSPTPAWPEVASSTTSWSGSEVIGPQVFRFEYYYLLKSQTNPAAATPTPTPYSPMFTDTPWDTRICSCPSPSPIATPTPTGTPIASPTPPSLCCHVAPEGMQDVAAVVVVIAVIDPKSKALLDTVDPTGAKLTRLNGADLQPQGPVLIDWGNTSCTGCPSQTQWQTTPGLLAAQWRAALDANTVGLPQPAISAIRVYERYFYLSPPTLLTP
jgi:hypothetical protein